jgi:hypothetical protein
MANPYQFQYPETGWSTGRMRKRGQKLAMMPGEDMVDPLRGKGLGGGGSLAGQSPLPYAPQESLSQRAKGSIGDAFEQIKSHLNDINIGDATMSGLKKLMKKLGWSGNPETGQFTDPEGKTHNIQADQTDATGSEAGPTRSGR